MVRSLILSFTWIIVAGCDVGRTDYPAPELVPEEVVAVATEYLTARQTKLDDYDLESLGFDYIDREWHLMYWGKSGVIGDHFALKISDEDKSNISVIPGL